MNRSAAAEPLAFGLNSYFQTAFGEKKRMRSVALVSLPAVSIVCLGVSLSTPVALWHVLGRRGAFRLVRDSFSLLMRGRSPVRTLGSARAPERSALFLIDKGKKKAFLLVDAASGSVVKAFPLPEKRTAFEHELRILEQLTAAGVSIAPQLLQDLVVPEHSLAWIRMSFHPNRRPVSRAQWPRFRNRRLTPRLFAMYRAVGPGMTDLGGYLARVSEAALTAASADVVQYLRGLVNEFARRAAVATVYTSLTHADIREGHVARNRHGWVLIDWGSADVRSVFYDLYVQERKAFKSAIDTKRRTRYPQQEIDRLYRDPSSNLWTALRLRSPAVLDGFQSGWQEVFCRQLQSLMGAKLNPDHVRCLVALAELERIAHNAGHRGAGDVCLHLLGAPVDISQRLAYQL